MDKKLNLTIMTPQRVIVENKKVDSVTLPAWEGEMCVLYNHIPYMGQLREGILKYRDGEKEEYFSIFWGFFEVLNNNIIILAEDAATQKDLNEEKLRQEYQRIKGSLITADKKTAEELEIQLKRIIVNLKLSGILKKQKK